jgi:hypothetical protein
LRERRTPNQGCQPTVFHSRPIMRPCGHMTLRPGLPPLVLSDLLLQPTTSAPGDPFAKSCTDLATCAGRPGFLRPLPLALRRGSVPESSPQFRPQPCG